MSWSRTSGRVEVANNKGGAAEQHVRVLQACAAKPVHAGAPQILPCSRVHACRRAHASVSLCGLLTPPVSMPCADGRA